MDALSVCPRGEAAPCYDAWVESSLFEEKPLRFVAEPGVLEESGVARGVEGILSFGVRGLYSSTIMFVESASHRQASGKGLCR